MATLEITTLSGMHPDDVTALDDVPFERFVVHLPSVDGTERIDVDDLLLAVLARPGRRKRGARRLGIRRRR